MAKPIVTTIWGEGLITVDVSEHPDMVKNIDYMEEGESIILKKLPNRTKKRWVSLYGQYYYMVSKRQV